MEILNHNLEWNQISSDINVGRAFRGIPLKTLIPAGRMLCRFITTESKARGIPGNNILCSPWWMDWSTVSSELAHWKTSRTTPRDVIRARLAVTTSFSQQLDSLVQIILTRPVYAWKGAALHQEDQIRQITYIGGGEQFFLPNLSSDPQGISSSVAYIHCFTAIDSLA